MRSEEEIRARIRQLHETLGDTYRKDMPYEEERLSARIEEDEWVLNDKGAKPGVSETQYRPGEDY